MRPCEYRKAGELPCVALVDGDGSYCAAHRALVSGNYEKTPPGPVECVCFRCGEKIKIGAMRRRLPDGKFAHPSCQ